MSKKLCKSNNRIIDGVCGGIAEYFNIDPTIVRIAAVIFAFFKGFGIILYIIAMFVMPRKEFYEDDIENLKSANYDSDDGKKSSGGKGKESDSGKKSGNEKLHSENDFDKYFK